MKAETEIGTEKEDRKRSDGVYREVFEMIFYMVFVVVATLLVIRFVGQRTEVSGHSMEPTLSHGDNLIVDKITYRFKDPERFDIIVFPYRYEENTFYIKRIIGLPGETVQITDGAVYINGEKLDESAYGFDAILNGGLAEEQIVLDDDEYFVLGDNRNGSGDSRYTDIGNVGLENIIGTVWFRVWPFQRIGSIR